jgi:hypothetical protein
MIIECSPIDTTGFARGFDRIFDGVFDGFQSSLRRSRIHCMWMRVCALRPMLLDGDRQKA